MNKRSPDHSGRVVDTQCLHQSVGIEIPHTDTDALRAKPGSQLSRLLTLDGKCHRCLLYTSDAADE